MLTIFTSCKPFVGDDSIAQQNAISSWKMLRPEPEIVIIGDDEGAEKFAHKLKILHVPSVERSEFGKPFVDKLFEVAQKVAKNDVCCYINSDIILLNDFIESVRLVASKKKKFLLIGKRYDLNVKEELTFESGWEDTIRGRALSEGGLYPLPGVDYFVFRKDQWDNIQPFVLGNIRWDNWMIYQARRQRIATIDGTNTITAIHQNHASRHAEESEGRGIAHDPAAVYNLNLYGKEKLVFSHLDASHMLTKDGLKRTITMASLKRLLDTGPILYPEISLLFKLLRRLAT